VSLPLGTYLGIEVMVVTNGSELGETILKSVWETAKLLFKDYGIEVFVVPYQTKGGNVLLVINGVEFPVTRPLTINELSDLILTAASAQGRWESQSVLGAEFIEEGTLGNGVAVA